MERNQISSPDIISNLPSNVPENILKGLPLRDAVRTSVLSSRWRYKWVTIPQLVFDHQFFLNWWDRDLNCWDKEILRAVIYQVLLFHQGPLVEFKLWDPPLDSSLDFNNWIFILLKKNIQELSLCVEHEIPCHLFSFTQLRGLDLTSCIFKPPHTFKGFGRLVDLDLFYVTICPEMFGGFISNCPLLERLKLDHCTNFESLKINAPNLKYFYFEGIFESVSFRNTPLLEEISISLLSWDLKVKQPEEETYSKWVKFFHSLPAIEDVHLNSSFLESFEAGSVPKRLPCTLNQLKVLALSDFCYANLDHVSRALCLLRSSPNLHRLQSWILNVTPIQDHATEFLQAQDFSDFSLNQLQEVEIWNFSGAEPELRFVKILLAHSVVLKKMVILHERGMSDQKGFAMVKELTRLPRSSSDAVLIVDVTQ